MNKEKRISFLTYVIYIITMVLLIFYQYIVDTHIIDTYVQKMFVKCILFPLIFIVGMYGILSLKYFKDKEMWLVLFIELWMVIGSIFWLHGAITYKDKRPILLNAGAMLVAFPMARFLDDSIRKKGMDIVLGILTVFISIGGWIALCCVFVHKTITILGLEFGPDYTATGRIQFKIWGMHQYRSGMLCSTLVFTLLYLVIKYRSKRNFILSIPLAIPLVATIVLSGGRTVIFGAIIGAFLTIVVIICGKEMKKKHKMLMIIAVCVFSLAVAIYGMNFIYKNITHSVRDVWYGITTLSNRFDIWASLPGYYKEKPIAAVLGIPYEYLRDTLKGYSLLETDGGSRTMHSSYFQAMAIFGVPGFLSLMLLLVSYLVNMIKTLWAKAISGVALEEKILSIIPIILLTQGLVETDIFARYGGNYTTSIVFFMILGYIIFRGKDIGK